VPEASTGGSRTPARGSFFGLGGLRSSPGAVGRTSTSLQGKVQRKHNERAERLRQSLFRVGARPLDSSEAPDMDTHMLRLVLTDAGTPFTDQVRAQSEAHTCTRTTSHRLVLTLLVQSARHVLPGVRAVEERME
jgi:hypothetical protein